MAVQYNADSEWHTSTTDVPEATTFTCACWVRVDVGSREHGFWSMVNTGYTGLYSPNSSVITANDQSNDVTVVSGPVVGDWYYICFVKNGTSKLTYYAGEGDTALTDGATQTVGSFFDTDNILSIGGWSPYGVHSRCSIAHFRLWTAALSKSELEAELVSSTAVRTTNLNREYRFANGSLITDSGPNGRTLTASGTPSFTADPTIGGGGAEVTGAAAGAFTFAAPASGTVTVIGAAATTLTFTTSVAGLTTVSGQAATALTFNSPAAGTVDHPATAATALSFSAPAAGVRDTAGQAATSFTFAAAVAGTVEHSGTAAATLTFSAPAAGTSFAAGAGQASTDLAFTASVAGLVDHPGVAATTLTFAAPAAGTVEAEEITGQAATSLAFAGPASGVSFSPGSGVASTDLAFTAAAVGVVAHDAQAASSFTFAAPAVGSVSGQVDGTAATALAFTATVVVVTVRWARATTARRPAAATTARRVASIS